MKSVVMNAVLLISATLLVAGFTPAQQTPTQQKSPADYRPNHDVTGHWVMRREVTGRDGTPRVLRAELILKQDGNKIVGEVPAGTILAVLPTLSIKGWIEGDDLMLHSSFDYEGGEHLRWRLVVKDGRLVGSRQSLHDAPHKWRLDALTDVDFEKAPN
jgi:hypothetical protein